MKYWTKKRLNMKQFKYMENLNKEKLVRELEKSNIFLTDQDKYLMDNYFKAFIEKLKFDYPEAKKIINKNLKMSHTRSWQKNNPSKNSEYQRRYSKKNENKLKLINRGKNIISKPLVYDKFLDKEELLKNLVNNDILIESKDLKNLYNDFRRFKSNVTCYQETEEKNRLAKSILKKFIYLANSKKSQHQAKIRKNNDKRQTTN